MTNLPSHMSDDLLVSYLLNEVSDEARTMVEEWIIEAPENRRYFDHFKLIWETSQHVALPAEVDENAAWKNFQKRIHPAHKTVVRSISPLRVAATVILCVGVAALSYLVWQKTSGEPVVVAANEKAVDQQLPDGSVVTLNRQSSIQYNNKFRGDQRNVQLKGEAFFKVTPDKKKPFIVELKAVKVTVVGTSFNIRESDSATDVIVESGVVKVESGNQNVLLHPGEKISVTTKGTTPLQVQKTNDKLYNYYATKEFVCDDTPLWKLVQTLNEAYGANIEIANPDVAKLPLTTTFHNEPLENILGVVSETFNLTVTRDGDRIILK